MLDKAYNPQPTESRIYKMWEENRAFEPKDNPAEKPFCIILPPPNANGYLHLGHAMYVIEDILVRWHRMQGHPTLWMPGTDHAGIETQVVYERKLEEEGRSRFDLGPDKFYDEVMRFTRANQKNMINQMRSMGFSADWSKIKFTLDEDIIDIVYDTFIALDRDGMVYRGNRVCNWCPRCQTSFADIEIKYQEESAFMYTLDYGSVRIGTTRPETIFADTAVAVNPDDKRYKTLVGKKAIVPLIQKIIPIIADNHVDPKIGTGALKVTPAHDFHDYEIGMRHKLPNPSVIDKEGRMINVPDELSGLVTSEARTKTVDLLDKAGVLITKEPLQHSVAHCERCGTVIEPIPTDQWYVKVDKLKQRSKEALEKGDIRIIPERFTKQCIDWLDQMYDWNVSRQIWWGIRMPVYYPLESKSGKKEYLIAKTEKEAKDYYGEKNYRVETDTFDTWFSSSQWPHATLATNGMLDQFYPTSVMETGRDILFKWVARMIMLGLYTMNDVPFRTVYLHGLVRDEKGQKMSKSKGNVINPLEMTSVFGTDALRMALTIGVTSGNDGSLSTEKVEGYRNFINKLWNASRFVLMQCEEHKVVPANVAEDDFELLSLADKALFHELLDVRVFVTQGLEQYRLSEVGERLYDFIWDYFCDWYLELSKGESNPELLVFAVREILVLLHPYCPFVTEELWSHVKQKEFGMLIQQPWPAFVDSGCANEHTELEVVIAVIKAIRKIRAEQGVAPDKKVQVIVVPGKHASVLKPQQDHIMRLSRSDVLEFTKKPSGDVASLFLPDGIEVHVSMEGLVDLEGLKKEQTQLKSYVDSLGKKLSNEQFTSRAPAAVIEQERQKLAEAEGKLKKIEERLSTS
ncbi:valine--tRNA ligase [Candidatus Peregrinibacteria bacterium]|nr:valine--tRNA ligase [Candidatus Peregrinibacteria bacterium]